MKKLLILVLFLLSCGVNDRRLIVGTFQRYCDGEKVGGPCLMQRLFNSDKTYYKKGYDYRGLAWELIGKWNISRNTIIVIRDSTRELDTTDHTYKVNAGFDLGSDTAKILFRNLDEDKIELFYEADDDAPAHWETWKRVK
jgi:hypothetical protein